MPGEAGVCLRRSAGAIAPVEASKQAELCELLFTHNNIVSASSIPEVYARLNFTLPVYFFYPLRTLLRYPVRWPFHRNWKAWRVSA